jgi:hypothetical protein
MTALLGDSFSESFRKKFCQDHLVPGVVLRFKSHHTHPLKIKRCVVIAVSEETVSLALIYINTEKPSSPHLQPWQSFFASEKRGYLEHDSSGVS